MVKYVILLLNRTYTTSYNYFFFLINNNNHSDFGIKGKIIILKELFAMKNMTWQEVLFRL